MNTRGRNGRLGSRPKAIDGIAQDAYSGESRGLFHAEYFYAQWSLPAWRKYFEELGLQAVLERILAKQAKMIKEQEERWAERGWVNYNNVVQQNWQNFTREDWNNWLRDNHHEPTNPDIAGSTEDQLSEDMEEDGSESPAEEVTGTYYDNSNSNQARISVHYRDQEAYDKAEREGRLPENARIYIAGNLFGH